MRNKLNKIFDEIYNLTKDKEIMYIKYATKYIGNYAIIDSDLLLTLDTRLIQLVVNNLCVFYFSKYNINLKYFYLNNYDIIIIEKGDKMKQIYNIDIPYGYRESYIDAIYEINSNVESEGSVFLFINNIPYCLQSFLYVETSNEKIIDIIREYNLKLLPYGKIMLDYIKQMSDKSWDIISFLQEMDKANFKEVFLSRYHYQSIPFLEAQGYKIPKDNRKIFISYSHKDKEIVLPFIKKLRNIGLSLWIDVIELDFGDNITDRIQHALKECEMSLLFLSENTKEALYQKYELTTIFNDKIREKKNFIPVKLDEVNPNDILYGLNNYLYVDFSSEEDKNKLISKLVYNSNKY